jgi:hypothetical protein
MRKYNEKMIVNNGKMIYAISLKEKSNQRESDRNYIYIRDGQVYFSDSWYSSAAEFDFNDEAHRVAKEIFVSQLQVDIKRRILELKQLEEIFDSIDLKECISDSIVNNSKILLELKEQVINETRNEINDAIKEQVKPIARKKPKKESKGE